MGAIGSINRNVNTVSVTADVTVGIDVDQIVANATSGAIAVTLYPSPGDGALHEVVVEKSDSSANAVTVSDGTFSFSLTNQYDSVICQLTQAGVWFGVGSFDVGGSGNVTGAASSTNGDLVTFSGSTGKVIADSGIVAASLSSVAAQGVTIGNSAASAAVVADSKAVSAAKGSPLGVTIVTATSVVTPNASATVALFECWGAGGGGGGCSAAANSAAAGGGGGSGGYSAKWVTALAGSTFSIGIGASGASGAANAGTGGTGGSTLVSTVVSAAGGLGGVGMAANVAILPVLGGAGGAVTTGGDINFAGNPGSNGVRLSGTSAMGGNGAVTRIGGGAQGSTGDAVGGDAAANTGAGGGGASCNAATARTGGAGGSGLAVITYYR